MKNRGATFDNVTKYISTRTDKAVAPQAA